MKPFKTTWPYLNDQEYSKPVAYFSMEYAIHQPLKIYAGGLGYIAGSYLRSAYTLKQNVTGIGILWKYGFYDQVRKNDQNMDVSFHEKLYHFLQKTDIRFSVRINNIDVIVTAYYLPPDIFNTAPLFLLSTDLPENEYWGRSITHKLYDSNLELRTAAQILLGVGGANLLDALNFEPEVYHLNGTDALPVAFFLMNKFRNVRDVKSRLVYTNYELEEAISQKAGIYFLERMNYFNGIPKNVVRDITKNKGDVFDKHLATLAMSGISNGLSQQHADIMNRIWKYIPGLSPIKHVTVGQNFDYWADHRMYKALNKGQDEALGRRKLSNKRKLFEEVAEQTGQIFDPEVLTLVWARKFTSDRRPDLMLLDYERFDKLLSNADYPIQIIFAGKPEPMDYAAISAFDKLVEWSKKYKNFAVLVGHELKLSKLLKGGADLWLNTQRHMYEASETSGISAAMNGSINFSTPEGWINEFAIDGLNSFIIQSETRKLSSHEQEKLDIQKLYAMLEDFILPMYYDDPEQWLEIMKKSMIDISPNFDSDRMVKEYYSKMYNFLPENVKQFADHNDFSNKHGH